MLTIEQLPNGELVIQLLLEKQHIFLYTGDNCPSENDITEVLENDVCIFTTQSKLIQLPSYYAHALYVLLMEAKNIHSKTDKYKIPHDFTKALLANPLFKSYNKITKINSQSSIADCLKAFRYIQNNPAANYKPAYLYHMRYLQTLEAEFDTQILEVNTPTLKYKIEKLKRNPNDIEIVALQRNSRSITNKLGKFNSFMSELREYLEIISRAELETSLIARLPKEHQVLIDKADDEYEKADAKYQETASNYVELKLAVEGSCGKSIFSRRASTPSKRQLFNMPPHSAISASKYRKTESNSSSWLYHTDRVKSEKEIALDYHLDKFEKQILLVKQFMVDHNIYTPPPNHSF